MPTKEDKEMYNKDKDAKDIVDKYNIICYEGLYFEYDIDKKVWNQISDNKLKVYVGKYLINKYNKVSGSWNKQVLDSILIASRDDKANILIKEKLNQIAFKDVIYNSETGKTKIISKEDYIRYKLDYKYDNVLNAKEPKKRLDFLDRMLVAYKDKQAVINTLQEYIGYCLIGSCSLHKFLLLVGSGGNGKGVFTKIIKTIIGNKSIDLTLSDNVNLNEIIKLMGKSVAFDDDMDGIQIDKPIIKKIVAGENISGKILYKDIISFKNTAKLILSTNVEPYIKNLDNSIQRRMILVRCEGEVKKPIPNLAQQIINKEGEGILKWCLEGLHRIIKNKCINIAKELLQGVEEYINEYDTIYQFMEYKDNMGDIGDGYKIQSSILYEEYKQWYLMNIGKNVPSQTYFGRHMNNKIFNKFKINKRKTRKYLEYIGIN